MSKDGKGAVKAVVDLTFESKGDKVLVNGEEIKKYNNEAYMWMTREKFGRLRARLLNLIDGAFAQPNQAKAMKGLVKDFCNDAYYDLIRDLQDFAVEFGIKDPNEHGSAFPDIEERETIVD